MSGPPKISGADVARYFALLQPPLIANRLFDDASFRAEFGLDSRDLISFGGGPAISKATLYDGIRKMFAEQRPQSLAAATGDTLTVTFNGDDIALSFPADGGRTTTAHSLNLMFLSPSADIRQAALRRMIKELGPTGPDPGYWQKEVQQGAVDDDRMDHLFREIDASLVPHMARVGRDIMTGVLDKTHLVPRSLAYWEALCGPAPDGMEQERWLKEIFEPHRQRLIDRDLAQGLDLCLAMSIRDDLTPRSLIAHVSHDDLWAALEQLKPIDDPFSLLGIVDLAVRRSGDDERFATLAAQTVERLCGAQLCRSDGLDVYAFLPALLDLAQAELRIAPAIASCPAYWRRICAWTQAALLVRAFQRVRFDAEQFSENTKPLIVAEAATAEFLDLRQSPLSYPAETGRICIHAEVLGRLLILQKREIERGRKLPGAAALSEAIAEQAKSAPYLSQMPGPLELDRLPAWQMENLSGEESDEFKSDLRRRADKLTSEVDDKNWLVFDHFSRLVLFDDYILGRILKLIPSTKFGVGDDDRRAALNHMGRLSYIALAQRNVSLAEAILTHCLQGIGPATDEYQASALIHVGFIATAASGQDSVIKERFAKYLRDLALLLPQGAPCRALCAELEVLKTFAPLDEWHSFAQTEALCLLGS
jgi:hypothetical protein